MGNATTAFQEVRRFLPHLTAIGALTFLSGRLVANLRFLRRAGAYTRVVGGQLPRVSVLVPARNEAGSISACVTSLLDQRYPNLELIVLDDASTDGTGVVLDTLQARSSRLRVLRQASDPPAGWTGKCYACHELARQATGEWLLFTDADTIHNPDSVARGVACAMGLDVAFLSAFPYQVVHSWSERVLVSFLLDFLPLLSVHFAALARGDSTRVAANGQYLLVNAATYRALGGHASIRGALVDDFALARRFQTRGERIALVAGNSMFACRMYHNADEVWSGFAKNLLGALDAPLGWRGLLWGPLFAWLYACLFVLPVVRVLASRHKLLAALEVGWLLLLRGVVVWRLKRPLDEVVTTPLAAWAVMALGIAALVRRRRHGRVVWKGRRYRE